MCIYMYTLQKTASLRANMDADRLTMRQATARAKQSKGASEDPHELLLERASTELSEGVRVCVV